MPDAHEAAVEAMALAECLVIPGPGVRMCGGAVSGVNIRIHPKCALAALVRSEAVRADLLKAASDHSPALSICCVEAIVGPRPVGDRRVRAR